MKRILSLLLSIMLFVTLLPMNILAAGNENDSTNENEKGILLDDGAYCVPLSLVADPDASNSGANLVTDWYRTALLEVENGQYNITFRIGSVKGTAKADESTRFKVLKEEYNVHDISSTSNYNLGNIDSGIYENSDYWREDVTYEISDTYGWGEMTFSMSGLNSEIVIGYYSSAATNRWTEVIPAYTQAIKLPDDLSDGNYDNWSYTLDNAFQFQKTSSSSTNNTQAQNVDSTISTRITEFINEKVAVEINEGIATATFQLTEQGQELGEVYYVDEYNSSVMSNYLIQRKDSSYEQVEINEDGTFQMKFDLSNYRDMVFGQVVKVLVEKPDNGRNVYFFGTLRLAENSVKSITLTDEDTGVMFLTTTANVPETSKLQVTVETEDEGTPSDLASAVDDISKNWKVYDVRVFTEDGQEITLSQGGSLYIPLPAEWASDYSAGRMINPSSGALASAGEIRDGYLVIEPYQTYRQYAIIENYNGDVTAENLADGTYEVGYYIRHLTQENTTSMANNAFSNPATMIVKDGTVRIELSQEGIYFGNVQGFLSRMYIMTDGLEYSRVIPYEYRNDEAGNLYQEMLGAGRQIYYTAYADKMYFEIPQDSPGMYQVKFRIPIMDGLRNVDEGYVGNADSEAYIIIDYTTAEKVSEEATEAPIEEALNEAIRLAEQLKWEEFTPSAWNNSGIDTALEEAKTAAEGNDSEKKNSTYWTLQTAVDYLGDHYLAGTAATDGLYISDANLSDEGASVDSARIRVNADNTTNIRIDTKNIQTFSYYSLEIRDYVNANAIQNSEGDVVAFSYILPSSYEVSGGAAESVYKNLAVKYTDANGEEHNTWLNIGELTSVSGSDKTSLGTALETANARIEEQIEKPGTYDDAAIAALETAVANALTVYNDPTAFQEEVDAQVTALETALGALAGDTTDLKALIETAKNEAENTDYTSESREELLDLIAEAEELLSGNPSAAEVEAMELKLQTFLDSGLVAVVDKMELQSLIETAEAIENDNYSGYDNLTSILESAKEVLNDDNATAEEVQDMIDALTAAISNLDDSVNKDDLRNLVDQAEGLIADGTYDGCTQESLNLLNSALTAAKAVLEDASASQADVDRHYQMIVDADGAMLKEQDGLADGVYETAVTVLQATDTDGTQTSMAHSAVVDHKAQVVVENGVPTAIRLTFQPLTITGMTGYLETIGYYANYHDSALPSGLTATSASVLSYYTDEEVAETFAYNNGVDPFASYRQTEGSYLKTVEIPVESDGNGGYYTEYWIQVYVPVMASINQASGTQNAKLRLDIDSWTDMTQISGATDTDKASLEQEITNASTLLDEVSGGSYRSEDVSVLEAAVTAGNTFNNNMNIDQTMVDKMVTALQSAQNLFTTQTIDSDKETLSERITEAEEALNREDVIYTDVSRQNLEWVLNAAKVVYGNPEATQTQVSWWAERLRQAIDGLNVISADKTELQAALEAAQERLKDTENYSGASLDTLQSLYDSALAVYENAGSSQTDVDRHASILNYYLNNMVQITESSDVVKDGLYSMLMTASNLAGRDSSFTDVTIKALKAAIEQADAVYTSDDVTQAEVNEQTSKLYYAILALETKPAETPGTGTGDGGSGNDNNDDGNNGGNTDLDIENLADGIYSIYGEMVKTDKTSESMSNAAINHTLKLTVEDGKYYITMNFNGLQYAGQYGYLKDLQYFLTGYTTNQYGVPQGDLADVTIDSYQADEDGNRVSDSFGTDYPDYVTFELIPEALEDGFVPLQVFVPIMESIADGTGTQAVYLKLDWSTLKLTSSDDPDFEDDGNNDNNNDNGDDGNNGGSGLTGGSSLTGGSTLGTSSLGGSSLGSSSLGGSSLGSSSLKSGSGLSSASSVKTDDTTAGYGGFAALLAIGCMAVLAGVMQRRTQKKDKETV